MRRGQIQREKRHGDFSPLSLTMVLLFLRLMCIISFSLFWLGYLGVSSPPPLYFVSIAPPLHRKYIQIRLIPTKTTSTRRHFSFVTNLRPFRV